MATAITVPAEAGKTWLGHPRGLFLLFFAEMWERFSYYGMRAILIFYLTKHFLFGEDKAYILYGAYTSLVYITPVIGGYLADRFLGPRKAVLVGGVFIAIGHFLIAITEGPGGQDAFYLNGFYLALASIIVGTGFLKANISVLVGELYARDDHRRDPAFSIFYMGINLGGASGPIVCGLLGELWGWSWGFGAAGVGMLLGLVMFVWLRPWLLGKGEPPAPEKLRAPAIGTISQEWTIYASAALGVAAIWMVIRYAELLGYTLLIFSALTVAYILWRSVTVLTKVERDRMFAALFLIALNPLFWGLFEQTGSSLNIFTDRNVDRVILGWDVPASLFQSVNSIYIILLAPLFAVLWTFLDKRRLEPSSPAKFGIGLILCGAGFLVLVAGGHGRPVADAGDLRLPHLPAPHHGGTLLLAGRPVGDDAPVGVEHGRAGDGHLVPGDGRGQFHRRPDRARHRQRRGGRRDPGAGRLQPHRLVFRGGRWPGAARLALCETHDASRSHCR